MRVSDCLHRVALAQEVPKRDIAILYFELLDNYWYLAPFSSIDNTIAAFTDVRLYLQLLPGDLSIGVELSVLGYA